MPIPFPPTPPLIPPPHMSPFLPLALSRAHRLQRPAEMSLLRRVYMPAVLVLRRAVRVARLLSVDKGVALAGHCNSTSVDARARTHTYTHAHVLHVMRTARSTKAQHTGYHRRCMKSKPQPHQSATISTNLHTNLHRHSPTCANIHQHPPKAFVFIGTSFAVGATAEALHQAEERGVPCFQFNLNIPAKLRAKPRLQIRHIIGESVATVPAFADATVAAAASAGSAASSCRDDGDAGVGVGKTDAVGDRNDSKRRRVSESNGISIGGSGGGWVGGGGGGTSGGGGAAAASPPASSSPALAATSAAAAPPTPALAATEIKPTSFGALSLVSREDAATLSAVEVLVRKHAAHDWTYPLSVVQGCTPGDVYADKDVTVAVMYVVLCQH